MTDFRFRCISVEEQWVPRVQPPHGFRQWIVAMIPEPPAIPDPIYGSAGRFEIPILDEAVARQYRVGHLYVLGTVREGDLARGG